MHSFQKEMNTSGVWDNMCYFQQICWCIFVKYDHFSGKFDCQRAAEINFPCAKYWMDAQYYVSFDVE